MRYNSKLFICLIFVIISLSISSKGFSGEKTSIAVFDLDVVERESAVWQSLVSQVNQLRISFQKNVKLQEDSLKARGAELESLKGKIDEKEFKKRIHIFREDRLKLKNLTKDKKKELDYVFNVGRQKIRAALNKIILDFVAEKDIDLILNTSGRSSVVHYVDKEKYDITDVLLERLNEKLKKLNLVGGKNE